MTIDYVAVGQRIWSLRLEMGIHQKNKERGK